MVNHTRKAAVAALFGEYELALAGLNKVIEDISHDQLVVVTDAGTADEDCRSVQAILAHVVRAGYNYAVQIANHRGATLQRYEVVLRDYISEYKDDLKRMFAFNEDVFTDIYDDDLEEHNNTKKMLVIWGQTYDIEQLMEHAIVHILRHRRQIEQIKRNEFKYVG